MLHRRLALYRMVHNSYLGDCLAIVFRPTKREIAADALQSPFVTAFVKTAKDLRSIAASAELQHCDWFDSSRPILLRIASECRFGVFGDSHCDCEQQRIAALREIDRIGQGVYVDLPQEAQGNGLFYKAQELRLQVDGIAPDGKRVGQLSVDDSFRYLRGAREELDKRRFTSLRSLFRVTGLDQFTYDLITSDSKRKEFLTKIKIAVRDFHVVERQVTVDNCAEYIAKLWKGYNLSRTELENIYLVLFSAADLPGRVVTLLGYLREELEANRRTLLGDQELLRRIANIPIDRGIKHQHATDLEVFAGVPWYDEYQVEFDATPDQLDKLFREGVLRGIESLRYEENCFYDLSYFKDAPTLSLKIRSAFQLSDRTRPEECHLVYKAQVQGKTYRIRAKHVSYDDDVLKLLKVILHDYETFTLPVFTHRVRTTVEGMTVLVKRYTPSLRTLSIMGNETAVANFVYECRQCVAMREIDDPTNYRYLDRRMATEFDFQALAEAELAFLKKYFANEVSSSGY